MITVEPRVTFDARPNGYTAATAPAWLPGRAEDIGRHPTVVDDLTVKWGRSGYYDAVPPAALTVNLWDSTGDWARRIRDNTALGQHIEVWAELTATRRLRLFNGAVSGVTAQRMDRTDDQGRHMWYVTLTCHDPLASLANIFPLPGVLARGRRMEDWKKWILELIRDYGGADVADISYQSAYRQASVWELEVGTDAADTITRQFFDSMSKDAFCYDSHRREIRQCERMDWPFTNYLASYGNNEGAVLIASSDAMINNRARSGIAVAGCTIDVGDGMTVTADPDTYVNRAETKFKVSSSGNNLADFTMTSENIRVGQARRVLSNDSLIRHDGDIPQDDPGRGLMSLQHRSMWDRAVQEGARPKHPPLVWHAGKQFTDVRTATWWLMTSEDARPAFVNGDETYSWLTDGQVNWEYSPLVSPLGGTVSYNGGDGWDFDLNVQWVRNRNVTLVPVTWSKLVQYQWTTEQDSVPWWWSLIGLPKPPPKKVGSRTPERDIRWGPPDKESGTYRFDTSVRWSDLRFIADGHPELKDILE